MILGGAILCFFALGFFIGRATYSTTEIKLRQIREKSIGSDKYKFIDPLLTCEVTQQKDISEFIPLKNKLLKLIKERTAQGDVATISIYLDRRDGRWLGINTSEKYFPASLMKVPTMMAFFKFAEAHPEILNKSVFYQGDTDLNAMEYFKPEKTLEPGHSYTIEELIERMIIHSDNNALPLLLNNIDGQSLEEVYADLGLYIPQTESGSLADFMTVKSYASFFRVLYNATYLNRAMSENALELLSKPDFSKGILAGVPSTVEVSQKFGERNFSDNPNDQTSAKELHDCGIVYYPEHPYLLCVMTKGQNFDKLAKSIADISRLVYQTVDSEVKK